MGREQEEEEEQRLQRLYLMLRIVLHHPILLGSAEGPPLTEPSAHVTPLWSGMGEGLHPNQGPTVYTLITALRMRDAVIVIKACPVAARASSAEAAKAKRLEVAPSYLKGRVDWGEELPRMVVRIGVREVKG